MLTDVSQEVSASIIRAITEESNLLLQDTFSRYGSE
jgi:hypothetical protein